MVPLGVVEVDDEPHPTRRHPDPEADAVVHRLHEVHVVTTVVRPLALEVQVTPEHRRIRVPGSTAEVLGPLVTPEAGPPQSIARGAVDEVVADVAGGEQLRVRP